MLFQLKGLVCVLFIGECSVLNFFQLFFGIVICSQYYVDLVVGIVVKFFDMCKILFGLCLVQKYVVICGGCYNYCIGFYDVFLIKENYIVVCGGIDWVIVQVWCIVFGKLVEVEVENFDELCQVLEVGVDIVMFDEFSLDDMCIVVVFIVGCVKLEVFGGINESILCNIVEIGVDYIFIGILIKDVRVVDLFMCFIF